MIPNKHQIELELEQRATKIRRSSQFHQAIIEHGVMISVVYKNHPMFYKVIFRNSRFIICSALLAIYYTQKEAALKDVKSFFKGKSIISENSLDSFLFFLRVGRWLVVKKADQDRRTLLFAPTQNALSEAHNLVSSMALPYQTLAPEIPVADLLDQSWFLPVFFKVYGQLMIQEIYLIDLVPQAALFITKDAGHMVLLMLFMESIRHNSHMLFLSSAEIAKFSSVSRTHINRILLAAEKSGLLTTQNNVLIELNSSFVVMAERYFSLYMAMVGYGLDGACQQHNIQICQGNHESV
ncbi:hypothetical protein [Serratia silvae]|uniref:Crp/Fnr family transcriptional regulator n=1 Tax=Serratia silvae TaxID=2824122 RepID=A0ABT0K7J3_9GAMM|nr:hypothetical protein [Serratia silvae]MCL1027709.1 hypothetical protein [Serratia silvae]